MSCIIHEYKFIFIHVAKCAGCSISNSMKNSFNEKISVVGRMSGHHTVVNYEKKFSHLFDEYFKFAFVRNPWDRIVSAYEDSPITMENIPKFEKFIDILYKKKSLFFERKSILWHKDYLKIPDLPRALIHFWPAHLCLRNEKGELKMDFIGRFENLQKDFNEICESIGLPLYKLSHHNQRKTKSRTRRSFYKDLYNDKTINQVGEIYKDDIELFGYEY